MQFREYRRKETVRAAEITEEAIYAMPANENEKALEQENVDPFLKGDYIENRAGELIGWRKDEFESTFTAVRAPRQSKATRKPRTRAATSATTTNNA